MDRAEEIIDLLSRKYRINLEEFIVNKVKGRPLFDMIIGVLLSQNTSDKNAIRALHNLRKAFGDPLNPCMIREASTEQIEELIKPAGMYKQRAKNVLALANLFCKENFTKELIDKIKTSDPEKARDLLISLPGIGIKSADVILNQYFEKPVFAVDTHIRRISLRLGVVKSKNYRTISNWWMKNLPQDKYLRAHLLLITHGRRTCKARAPKCSECPIRDYCEYYKSAKGGQLCSTDTQ